MRKRIVCLAFLAAVLLFVENVSAQMFAGYDQFCGVPVIIAPNPMTASAARDNYGRAVIYIDPGAMGNWTHSRMFTLAHECAHHGLGHTTPQGMWFRNTQQWATRAQELQADCRAAQALVRIGYVNDVMRVAQMYWNQGGYSTNGYPSGRERALNIRRCIGM